MKFTPSQTKNGELLTECAQVEIPELELVAGLGFTSRLFKGAKG